MRTRTPGTFVCFSHLRWNFVFQRPQHILSRAARHYRVIFIEEPIYSDDVESRLNIASDRSGVTVVTPMLPPGQDAGALLDNLLATWPDERLILWYYTPLALAQSRHLDAELVVYDCMDELSAFKFAPPAMKAAEASLLERADIVFTGGRSLYEAKRKLHSNVHAFPSSVDAAHFNHARQRACADPLDASIARPRMGFFGVIDERLDTDLVAGIADLRPDWSFVMLGPVVKIDSQSLPQRPNIHWIGGRDYQDLPQHLAHWDVGIMPFALNEATRFISPTKTPEFLAAGLPVVSSPIADVVRPYGELGLVEIAADAEAFVRRCEEVLVRPRKEWLADVDTYLSGLSWDRTWNAMHAAMKASIRERRRRCMPSRPAASLRPEPEEGVNVRV